jgi:hypothetical protein
VQPASDPIKSEGILRSTGANARGSRPGVGKTRPENEARLCESSERHWLGLADRRHGHLATFTAFSKFTSVN